MLGVADKLIKKAEEVDATAKLLIADGDITEASKRETTAAIAGTGGAEKADTAQASKDKEEAKATDKAADGKSADAAAKKEAAAKEKKDADTAASTAKGEEDAAANKKNEADKELASATDPAALRTPRL